MYLDQYSGPRWTLRRNKGKPKYGYYYFILSYDKISYLMEVKADLLASMCRAKYADYWYRIYSSPIKLRIAYIKVLVRFCHIIVLTDSISIHDLVKLMLLLVCCIGCGSVQIVIFLRVTLFYLYLQSSQTTVSPWEGWP